jgi:hypothetical protein
MLETSRIGRQVSVRAVAEQGPVRAIVYMAPIASHKPSDEQVNFKHAGKLLSKCLTGMLDRVDLIIWEKWTKLTLWKRYS